MQHLFTSLQRQIKRHARWRDLAIGLVIAGVTFYALPGLLPLVLFGVIVCLFGDGLIAFTVGVAGGVVLARLYPSLFHSTSYNAGQGPVTVADLVMSQVDSILIGLLVLSAFFALAFKNRYFMEYALPLIRSRLRTAAGRLRCGWVLAFSNFSDDFAAGGILNRLYENDVKSPAVKEAVKHRMLLSALLLANAFPAVIPCSSWTAFYGKVNSHYHWTQSAYIVLPLMLICFCFWMAFDPWRHAQRNAGPAPRQGVLPVDFLRERTTPDPGMPRWFLGSILSLPFLAVIALLVHGTRTGDKHILLHAFAFGLVCQIAVVTGLGQYEHRWRRRASPLVPSPDLTKAGEALAQACTSLVRERARLIRGPAEMGSPPVCNGIRDAVQALAESEECCHRAGGTLSRMPTAQERLYPALRPSRPLCFRLHGFWRSQSDVLLKEGIVEMVVSLLRVYLMLILSSATSVCLGKSLRGDGDAVNAMLAAEGRAFGNCLAAVSRWNLLPGWNLDLGLLFIGLLVVLLLWILRYLRLSSAWGVLAIVWPLVAVVLDAIDSGSAAVASGVGRSGAASAASLVSACFFGLILSFGVWCNSTLPTGDNVSITAEIQGRDPEDLASRSAQVNQWPLRFSAVGLCLALVWHRQLEGLPPWLLWGALPIGWSLICSTTSYWILRQRLLCP